MLHFFLHLSNYSFTKIVLGSTYGDSIMHKTTELCIYSVLYLFFGFFGFFLVEGDISVPATQTHNSPKAHFFSVLGFIIYGGDCFFCSGSRFIC